ncbi:MAG: hypothetical protein ACOY0R_19180 [Chloroflexota bacterium]
MSARCIWLDGVSPELRRHVQGKSCFDFKKSDPVSFDELAGLTRAGCERFREEVTKP